MRERDKMEEGAEESVIQTLRKKLRRKESEKKKMSEREKYREREGVQRGQRRCVLSSHSSLLLSSLPFSLASFRSKCILVHSGIILVQ